MKRAILVFLVAASGACLANREFVRKNNTTFEPFPEQGSFRFVVTRTHDPEYADREQERIGWLQRYLADNAYCPRGYDLTERKVVVRDKDADEDGYAIYYYGKCK